MRLRWLRLRYSFGLGRTPADLRYRAREYRARAIDAAKLTLGFIGIVVAICVLVGGVDAALGYALWFIVPVGAIGVIASIAYAFAAADRSKRASLAEHTEPVSGQCFTLIADLPVHIFAQVGYTFETARWYCMPMQWEPFLSADGVSIALEASPVTGYVAQLKAIGFYEVDLSADGTSLDEPLSSSPSTEPASEINAYLRKVRSYALAVEPRTALRFGIGSLLLGVGATFAAILTDFTILFAPYSYVDTAAIGYAVLVPFR
jgi:hypothetical protein